MALISDPVSAVAGVVQSIIEKFPSQEQKDAANLQMAQLYMSGELQKMTAQAGVITAEANSTNRLTSSWRPMLMYTFMAIIANNYILAPYLQAMFHVGLQLNIPPDMWELLRLGVGGYVVGRSVEKAATALTGKSVTQTATSAVTNLFKGN